MLAQKTLKAKRPYATYFVAAHGGNPMYCGYVTVDGTELNPWFAKGPYISAEEYPLSKQPYPITDWEQLDIQSHSKRRVGSAASLVGPSQIKLT